MFAGFIALCVDFRLWVYFGRAGEIIDNRIEYQLDTLVFERGAAIGGEEVEIDGALADALFNRIDVGLIALEIGFHRCLVLLDCSFDELFTVFLDLVDHISRHVFNLVIQGISGVVPNPGLAGEQVDHADEITFEPNRKHHDERDCAEDILYLIDDFIKVGTDTVELVNINDT